MQRIVRATVLNQIISLVFFYFLFFFLAGTFLVPERQTVACSSVFFSGIHLNAIAVKKKKKYERAGDGVYSTLRLKSFTDNEFHCSVQSPLIKTRRCAGADGLLWCGSNPCTCTCAPAPWNVCRTLISLCRGRLSYTICSWRWELAVRGVCSGGVGGLGPPHVGGNKFKIHGSSWTQSGPVTNGPIKSYRVTICKVRLSRLLLLYIHWARHIAHNVRTSCLRWIMAENAFYLRLTHLILY